MNSENLIGNSDIHTDKILLKKMTFVMNALEKGWRVKKSGDMFIFTKKHENRKEIFMENYLETFVISNMDI